MPTTPAQQLLVHVAAHRISPSVGGLTQGTTTCLFFLGFFKKKRFNVGGRIYSGFFLIKRYAPHRVLPSLPRYATEFLSGFLI